MKEEGIYKKRLKENGAKKQREEAAEIDKNKTRQDKIKPDGARPKRDELTQVESTNKRAQEKSREQRRTQKFTYAFYLTSHQQKHDKT